MPNNVEEILSQAIAFEKTATNSLMAEAKKKEKKKLDPKAKVRNRGTVCVPAESAKDKKDHFPINDEAQARNALARVHQYSSAPPWYSGSLKGLQDLVSRKVHSKYPGIGKSEKKSKKSAYYDDLLNKYGQGYGLVQPPAPAEDTSGPAFYSPPKSMNAPAEREQQAPSYVKEVFDTRTNKWYPSRSDAELSAMPEGTRARYHSGEEYVYFTKTKDGWDEEGKTPTPAAQQPAARPAARPATPVREDVRAAQNVLYNAGFATELGPTGVDGRLGPKTIAALRTYLPRMHTEDAIKYLAEEYNKSLQQPQQAQQAQQPAQPQKPQLDKEDPWATPKAPSTWGTG